VIKGVATVVSVAVATIVAAVAGAGRAGAATVPFTPCHGTSGVLCATVNVPLDWSGVVPGTIPLAVEELPAKGTPRGVMMMVAGGPGQASAIAFDLAGLGSTWQSLFPGYTLVAFDPRGTGNSGFLGCSIGSDPLVSGPEVAACGASLGPARVFYTTAANAEDMDAVRQALGVDKIAMWGTSYGTKVELAYALAHPDHVERMILDSVVTTNGPDPLGLDQLQNMPLALRSMCGNAACHKISPDLAGEVVSLANRAAVTPIRGRVRTAAGQLETVSLDGPTLLGIVVSADLSPGLEAELPSAVDAAALGRPQALLRLAAFEEGGFGAFRTAADTSFSEGLFLATMCNDGRFPWAASADAPGRQQALAAAVAALPAGATGPFGSWATSIGPATYCLPWPSPSGNAPLAAGPLPDVPVLALSGSLDMRTPTANAASVVAQFPQGHLVVVPGVGHSVLTVDPSGCAAQAVKTWLDGGTPPARCAPARPYVADVPKIPVSVAKAPRVRGETGLRGHTLSAAESTVQDALAATVTAGGSIGGLAGGKAEPEETTLVLTRYSDVPGLAVTGTLSVKFALRGSGPVYALSGSVTVSGAKISRATLTYKTGSVSVRWAPRG
jgi:pimeloyl-ACP methyl ester carboxylesterase